MAFDKESIPTSIAETDSDAAKDKKSKKKKRVPSHVPILDIGLEDQPKPDAEAPAKKKRSRNRSKSKNLVQPTEAELVSNDVEVLITDVEQTPVEIAETPSDTVEIGLVSGDSGEIRLHDPAAATTPEVSADTPSDLEQSEEREAPTTQPKRKATTAKKAASPAGTAHTANAQDHPAVQEQQHQKENDLPLLASVSPAEMTNSTTAVEANTFTVQEKQSLERDVARHERHERRQDRVLRSQARELERVERDVKEVAGEVKKARQETSRAKTPLETRLERLRSEATVSEPTPVRTEAPLRTVATAPESKPNQPSPKQEKSVISVPEEERPALSPDRRVESSSWHRIEIDKKTGKPVEDPTLAYGQEFNNEQHQEQLRKQVLEASMEAATVREAYQSLTQQKKAVEQVTPTPLGTGSIPKPQPVTSHAPVAPAGRRPQMPIVALQDLVLWGILFIVLIAIFVAL